MGESGRVIGPLREWVAGGGGGGVVATVRRHNKSDDGDGRGSTGPACPLTGVGASL